MWTVAAVAALVAVWTRLSLANVARQPLLCRRNYLGEEVIGSAGLAFVGAAVVGWLLLSVGGELVWHESGALSAVALWFGALGLLDDIAGDPQVKGLGGHWRTLWRERRLTTGMVKALGGGLGALVAAACRTAIAPVEGANALLQWLVGATLIALSANALNLLDVRPARALKGFWLLSAVGVAVAGGSGWVALVPLWAGTLAYAPADFRRHAMLGDAGANPLGACLGLWLSAHWDLPAQAVLVGILVAFHLYAERRSLTADIERVALLRWLDNLGVRRDR